MKEGSERKVYLDFFAQRPISNKDRPSKVKKSQKSFFMWNGLDMQKFAGDHPGHPCEDRFQKLAKL